MLVGDEGDVVGGQEGLEFGSAQGFGHVSALAMRILRGRLSHVPQRGVKGTGPGPALLFARNMF